MLFHPLSRRAFLAATAAGALALAGCRGGDGGGEAPSEVPAPLSPSAIESGVADALTAAVAYEGGSCNPIGTDSALFVAAGWHVFEGLYELDLHTYRAENGLAGDVPVQVSELEYEVTLRENPLFSDGTPVTVADVCNAFARNMASDLYGPFLSFIRSVTAKDEQTITFKLNSPMGILLKERLALVRIFPAALPDEVLDTLPIGSGPWRYEAIDGLDGGAVSFVPNEHYTGPFPATCRRMVWSVILDDEKRTEALASRQVLCMEAAPEVLADQLADAGATVDYVPGFNAPFLMFNCAKAPFDDARVRQALLYAIDIDRLIAQCVGGHGRPCTSLLPDYFRGYHRASTIFSYDPEKARALLLEAEVAVEELALTLRCNDNWVSDLTQALVDDWEALGITVEVQPLPTEALFADLSTPPQKGQELPFDVVLSPGDPSCYGNDPDLIMSWWYGDNVWTQGRSCWADTGEFRKLTYLLGEARATEDENEQQNLWNQCFDIIATEVPLYPLFHRETATAYYEANLDDYDPISTTGLLFLGTTPMEEVTTL